MLPCTEELSGVHTSGNQQAPSRHRSDLGCALDKGDVLGHPLGFGGADLVGAGSPLEGTGPPRSVGGQEHSVEEDNRLTEVFDSLTLQYLPLTDYNPYDLSKGQALHSPADPTLD